VRVPVYEQQVGSQAVGLPVDQVRAPSDAGLQQGLASLDRAGAAIFAKVKAAEDKAIAAEVTDSETNFTRLATGEMHGDSATGKTGFMALQGRAAESDGATVMERIEKHRQQVASALKNDAAKKLFLSRTGRQVESLRGSVETHVSHERQKADVASVKARADAATEAMFNAARLGDGATVQLQSIALETSIRALALSPEDAERDVAQWRRSTVATQLDAFLDVDRVDVAEALLKDSKDMLGPVLSKKYEAAIDKVKGLTEAEKYVTAVIGGARLPNGQVDEARVLRMVDEMEPAARAKAEPIANQHLARERKAWDEETERISRESYTAVNRTGWAGFARTPLADRLNDRNPRLWDQLRDSELRSLERAERRTRIRANDAAARREQAAIDKIGLNEWDATLLTDAAGADIDSFRATHADMSEQALSELEKRKLKAVKANDKAGPEKVSSFTTSALADAEGFLPPPGSTKKSKDAAKEARDDFRSKAQREYFDFVEEHGRAPTSAEAADMRARLVIGMPVKPSEPGTLQRNVEAVTRLGGKDGAAKPSKAERARALRAEGRTNQQIADTLNAEGY
jgi:hypothetical protein